MASITVGGRKGATKWYLAAAGVAALALAIAAGIGIWQNAEDESTSADTAPVQEAIAAPVAPQTHQQAGGPLTFVLLDSHEKAAQINGYRAALVAAGALDPQPDEVLLVVTTEAELAEAQRLIADTALLSPTGDVRVVDLRVR